MPVKVQKRGSQYCVVEPNGTVKKCYKSKEEATKYMQAINIHLHDSKAERNLDYLTKYLPAEAAAIVRKILTKESK